MKKTLKSTAFFLAVIMAICAVTLCFAGCDILGLGGEETTSGKTDSVETDGFNNDYDTGAITSPSESTNQDTEIETQPPVVDGKVEYTVTVRSIGGLPLAGINFYIYNGEDLISYGKTDSEGVGKINLKPQEGYEVELPESDLEGYVVEGRYAFTDKTADIVLTSSVIMDSDLTGVQYGLGDIIRDFSVVTTTGETFTLSEALKTKKGVLINFWYSTCSPCINEFPYMQSAYEKFSDDIEVIALNNYAGDNDMSVSTFKAEMGLTFPVAKDYSRLGSAFSLQGYPTSIFVDRYGTICLIEIGGLTSEKPFIAAFEHFSAENYEQKLLTSISELTPIEKPNVEMPSSEEINAAMGSSAFGVTYTGDTTSADAEYSWPFIVGDKDGQSCIYSSNKYKDASFATLHATLNMEAGEALAIDWFASSEIGVDILYILVNEKDIYRLSGVSESWATCFPFVANESGEYKVSFIYFKDDSTDVGDDTVYLRNFRKVSASEVNTPTYIPRQAATKPNNNGLGFQNYITPVFNTEDGYYHVGSANGPLLLANLMGDTLLSKESLNMLGYDGKLISNGTDLYETLVTYCNYSINGTIYGYSPVTEELKQILEAAAEIVGFEKGNPNQWLQACSYYDAYGTETQLEDPVKGIAFFAAYDTVLSTDTETKYNTVVYDGRVIMPRGLKFKLVPEKSGVYFIKSQSEQQVDGWIFDDKYECIHTASVVDRPYGEFTLDLVNVSMVVYLEAGETYYIDIAFYDIYAEGSFTFTVNYVGESYNHFHLASPGYFTFIESTGGQMNETIAGGINVTLGDDGYYHELRDDGSIGSIVYADFSTSTGMFSHSIVKMIEMGGFNFSLNETDHMVLAKLEELGGDKDACLKYYKDLLGDSYAEWQDIYKLEEVLAGKYHGNGQDLTAEISAYIEKMIAKTEEAPELEGCVPVDAELANLLQMIMDKYSFKGVEHSWTKLCYYYKYLGAPVAP